MRDSRGESVWDIPLSGVVFYCGLYLCICFLILYRCLEDRCIALQHES